MLVQLLDTVAVSNGELTVRDASLGGRRARIVLAALALDGGTVTAERLASLVWGDALPVTWSVAVRGVVRGLRTALAPIGGAGQTVIRTVPTGYRLADEVSVDATEARSALRRAESHAAAGRNRSVVDEAEALTLLGSERLLPGDDADWLAPHRIAMGDLAVRATELVVDAAGALDEHHHAVELARGAVARHPLDERAHRMLIRALDLAGDRSGAARAYETCRAALADELGVDPSADTIAVYLDAIGGDDSAPSARPPVDTSSFVGRQVELGDILQRAAQPGLVTITGRGGVGKSRLAQQVAAHVDVPGGRSWASLAAVADDELVATSVVLQLGIEVAPTDTGDGLARRLAPLGRALLVLDGCEAVVDGVASLTAALLVGCPALTVLVTSRVPLGLDGEQVLALAPLPAPEAEDAAVLAANPQVRILLDRVQADGGSLRVDSGNAALIATLCRRCGGLPLALELAAAQLTEMPVGDLLDQLDDLGPVPGDQLRSMARGSYALLGADEAAVFRRLAVLDGAVGLPLVRAVVAGPDVPPVRVVRIMRELSARGLVNVDRSGPRWRYQQDDDLHRFARELLDAEGAAGQIFDRLAVAVRALLPDDAASPPARFVDDVSAILDSVRSLFGAALDGRAEVDTCLELAFRLHRYWAATTVAEGRFWLSRLLAAADPDSAWRRYAAYALGYLSYWSASADEALRDLQAAIELFGDEPDPFVARAYIYVGGLLDDMDRSAEALDYVHRAITAAEPFGTDLYVAAAMGIGSVLSERGDPAAARYAGEAVARCRVDGSADQLGVLLPTAAMICWQVGALDEARAYVDEAWPVHAGGRRRIARVVLLAVAAGLALADDDVAGALEFSASADEEATELGVDREIPLIRSVRARAMLAAGDGSGAADRALAALDVAAANSVGFPLAICLETAAVVLGASGSDADAVRVVLAVAGRIRDAGDRPAPFTLRRAVVELQRGFGTASLPASSTDDALALSRRHLAALVARDDPAVAQARP